MFRVAEYDEDPALQQQENEGSSGHLLSINTSIPRREFKLDLCSLETSSELRTADRVSLQRNVWHAPKQVLVDLFLPLGFPHSVDSSYLAYQFYDSLQGLCSYLRGVVSTSAVLSAAGVGNSEATAMGAAMTWAMKDGLGMVGGLIFSYYASPHFDANVKEFRLFADLINDVGLTLDMMAPLVPSSWLLGIMSASTLSKTMCGMSAGATKSSITVHLAVEGNIADLNAKEGTQETLVSLLGMLLGVQLAKQLENLENHYHHEPLSLNGMLPGDWQVPVEFAVSWSIFLFLTWLHMWANYRGVKLLKLNTLNRERATVALGSLSSTMAHQYFKNPAADSSSLTKIDIPCPHDVEESMLRATYTILFPRQQSVALGMPLLETLQSSQNAMELLEHFNQERYILNVDQSRRKVRVTLRTGAQQKDELKAFIHSLLLYEILRLSQINESKHSIPSDTLKLVRKSVLLFFFGSQI
jgi:hypothetical protein